MRNFLYLIWSKWFVLSSQPPAWAQFDFFYKNQTNIMILRLACVCVPVTMCAVCAPDYIWVSHLFRLFAMDFRGNLLLVRNSVCVYTFDCIEISFVVGIDSAYWFNVNKINEPSCFIEWEKLIELYTRSQVESDERVRVAARVLEMLVAVYFQRDQMLREHQPMEHKQK